MEWLQSNWVWIALGIGFVALHWFGHGGHGHGGDGRYGRRDRDPVNTAPDASVGHDHASTTAATTANSNDPARRGATDHVGHGTSPKPADSRRHRHGC